MQVHLYLQSDILEEQQTFKDPNGSASSARHSGASRRPGWAVLLFPCIFTVHTVSPLGAGGSRGEPALLTCSQAARGALLSGVQTGTIS